MWNHHSRLPLKSFISFLFCCFIEGASREPEERPRPMQPVIVHPEMDIDVSRPATVLQRHLFHEENNLKFILKYIVFVAESRVQ